MPVLHISHSAMYLEYPNPSDKSILDLPRGSAWATRWNCCGLHGSAYISTLLSLFWFVFGVELHNVPIQFCSHCNPDLGWNHQQGCKLRDGIERCSRAYNFTSILSVSTYWLHCNTALDAASFMKGTVRVTNTASNLTRDGQPKCGHHRKRRLQLLSSKKYHWNSKFSVQERRQGWRAKHIIIISFF
jgi:hypothetical protein